MEIMQIVTVAIVVAVIAILVKKLGAEFGITISIVGGVLIFFMVLPHLIEVMGVFNLLSQHITVASGTNAHFDHIGLVLRILGIAYIAEFGAQVCKDAGEGAIASKIEMAGKVIIMVVSTPIIVSFLNLIIMMV